MLFQQEKYSRLNLEVTRFAILHFCCIFCLVYKVAANLFYFLLSIIKESKDETIFSPVFVCVSKSRVKWSHYFTLAARHKLDIAIMRSSKSSPTSPTSLNKTNMFIGALNALISNPQFYSFIVKLIRLVEEQISLVRNFCW